MKYAAAGTGDLAAIKSDGTIAPVVIAVGCTLTSGTWYFAFGSDDAPLPQETPLVNVQLQWDATTAGTFTLEVTNYPRMRGGVRNQGAFDVPDNDANATKTNWVQLNPTTLYVPTPTGAGNSATNLTITAGGTNAGGTGVDIGNFGWRRGRIKVVLTVGGVVRVCVNGKAGG